MTPRGFSFVRLKRFKKVKNRGNFDNIMKPGKDFIGLGVGAIIQNDFGEILLLRREKTDENRTTTDMWSSPGGEVLFGEAVEDAVKREVKEEIGVDVEISEFIGYTDQILDVKKVHWHLLEFICEIKKGTPKIMEPDNFSELKWFKLSEIPMNTGISHVIKPLYQAGLISKAELERRIKSAEKSS